MIEDALMDQVWLPSPEGKYAKIELQKKHTVWLGGVDTHEVILDRCQWSRGQFSVDMQISSQRVKAQHYSFKGVAQNETQLCSALISQVAAVSKRLSDEVGLDRLLDLLLDQVIQPGQETTRLSQGIGGEPWISHKIFQKIERETDGCNLQMSGQFFLHPAVFLQRIYTNHKLPKDWAQRLNIAQPERLIEPPTLFLDITKPNKGVHFPSFNHTGVIITGYRGGLESWAVGQAIEQRRPYLQIRNYRDIERLINLMPGARLITPYQRSKTAFGKIRSSLIEMVNAGQSQKRTA